MGNQLTFFEEVTQPEKLAKPMFQWSIYAVTRYSDGGHIETTVRAYTERQARFLFYKNHSDYMITGIYRI